MTQPIKYLKIVGELVSLYQRQLIRLFRKYPGEEPVQFGKHFSTSLIRLKQAQINKCIDDGISPLCQKMQEHLKGQKSQKTQKMPEPRYNKTSIDHRRNLRSQAGTRLMGLTGALKRPDEKRESIQEESELTDIIQSYKIEEEIVPRMRMKWKSGHERIEEKDVSTIGTNNIHLLSYAIPEIQNSIRRLSYQKSPKSAKERELDVYRTMQTKSFKKKYNIARLF